MLNFSDLTIVKNGDGVHAALGYPINSLLLKNNRPLFMSGGGKKKQMKKDKNIEEEPEMDLDQFMIPAGLVCRTQTICTNEMGTGNGMYETNEPETVPEGLYEALLALAETKPPKKLTKRHNKPHLKAKNKTKRRDKGK